MSYGIRPAALKEIMDNAGIVVSLAPEQLREAKGLDMREMLAIESIKLYGFDQAKVVWRELVDKARNDPSAVNMMALESARSKEDVARGHDAARKVTKAVLADLNEKEIFPFVFPILQSVLVELEDALQLWTENDVSARSKYPSLELLDPSPILEGVAGGVKHFRGYLERMKESGKARGLGAILAQVGVDLTSVPWPKDSSTLPTGDSSQTGQVGPSGTEILKHEVVDDDPDFSAHEILKREAVANGGHDPGVFAE